MPFELQPVLVGSVYFPLQILNLRFESSVILNGSKTAFIADSLITLFESSVILNGSKTAEELSEAGILFERSVILNKKESLKATPFYYVTGNALDVPKTHQRKAYFCTKNAQTSFWHIEICLFKLYNLITGNFETQMRKQRI